MNIVIFCDKIYSAIDRLAGPIKLHNKHFNIKISYIHPKRNPAEIIFEAQDLLKWADIVDVHYWRSGEVIKSNFPVDFEAKPKIVCHFNPYDLAQSDWKEYKAIVVGNKTQQNIIPSAHLIPYGIDLDFFSFNPDHTEEKIVMMSVARIESKKGILEVAKVCKELGYKFILVGRVSDGPYVQEILDQGAEFIENATEEILRDTYYKSAIHVCNSTDNFESGTLPILEAMATGVPVLTRNIGHVPDLYNGKNMVVREGAKDDTQDLKTQLKDLMENRERRLKIREAAWQTVKNRSDKKMARQFSNLYYKLRSDKPLVSIIIPTFDRGEPFIECLAGALSQDYENFEVVIADSGNRSVEVLIDGYRRRDGKVPVKYVGFANHGNYTLAEARNRAVIEAEGEYLLFCDDRLKMNPDCISQFVERIQPETWAWGVKDDYEKDFVENLSFIRRRDLIRGGMFLERVNRYGGMSQEIRTRFSQQGLVFEMVKLAKAYSIVKSGDSIKKKKDMIEAKLILSKLYE